jgi:hypothetical protein
MQGNWDGYTDEDMLRPGHDVQNILIEHSVLSTSISNIVRAGWPRKTFNSRNFTLRDSDILHGGIGACGQTFGLLGFWGANGAKGDHSNYTFENLFLDNWYSLVQMEQEYPACTGSPSATSGRWISRRWPIPRSRRRGGRDLRQREVRPEPRRGDADLPLVVSAARSRRSLRRARSGGGVHRSIRRSLRPGRRSPSPRKPSPGARYTWLFGDGTQATAARVRIAFPTPRAPSWTAAKRRGPLQGSAARGRQGQAGPIRTGPRREWWPWPNGTMPQASPGPRCPASPGRSIPENGPSCPT